MNSLIRPGDQHFTQSALFSWKLLVYQVQAGRYGTWSWLRSFTERTSRNAQPREGFSLFPTLLPWAGERLWEFSDVNPGKPPWKEGWYRKGCVCVSRARDRLSDCSNSFQCLPPDQELGNLSWILTARKSFSTEGSSKKAFFISF